MKIGIIVHSQTGNTLNVANRLKDKLMSLGHTVNLEQVTAVDGKDKSASKNILLKSIPDTSSYDGLIFGAPVWGGSISPVMKAYLSQISSLQGKKVSCFVTHFFPFAFMGGDQAISQFKKCCEFKNGNVSETCVVNWSNKNREKNIAEVIEKLSK